MLRVLEPGPFTTVQDLGRRGWARFGVPASGAMDSFALRAANRLVGNDDDWAGLEIGLGDVSLEATDDTVIAATGAGYDLFIGGRHLPFWMSALVRRGWPVELKKTVGGCWAYLGLAGGIQCPIVLGARATNVRGKFGGLDGRPLRGDDILSPGVSVRPLWSLAGREVPESSRPSYSPNPILNVILGQQADHFTEAGLQTFLASNYAVLPESDRMGYRLSGPAVTHLHGADIVSDGMVQGSVQVPASGQPIVMLADGPTTGGYPKIATVISADRPLLAQCAPGEGRVRFTETTVEAAQSRYRSLIANLRVVDLE